MWVTECGMVTLAQPMWCTPEKHPLANFCFTESEMVNFDHRATPRSKCINPNVGQQSLLAHANRARSHRRVLARHITLTIWHSEDEQSTSSIFSNIQLSRHGSAIPAAHTFASLAKQVVVSDNDLYT